MRRPTPDSAPATVTPEALQRLLAPYLAPVEGLRTIEPRQALLVALLAYLDLLLRWNARTNLTAIREPAEIVRRHFGESLLLARLCPEQATTVLDLGSGAGFPGLPMQLAWPELNLTLAESQGKKAAFLREVVRALHLPTEVWANRAEDLSGARHFDVVAMRAVDRMQDAVALAGQLAPVLLVLATVEDLQVWPLYVRSSFPVPGSSTTVAALCEPQQVGVPRGTPKANDRAR